MFPWVAMDAVPEAPPVHTWVGRVSVGAGNIGASPENDLLYSDGQYGGARVWTAVDGAWLSLPYLGVGGWAALASRTSQTGTAHLMGPTLNELDLFVGGTLFLYTHLASGRKATFDGYLGLRGGVGVGALGFGSLVSAVAAPVWGVEAGLRLNFIGISLGILQATQRIPTDLGRSYDLGGIYFWVNGYFGG